MAAGASAFLANALGPGAVPALPYGPEYRPVVQQHMIELLGEMAALRPMVSPYVHTDGRQVTLLQAKGTIPMHYHGVKYNIPVAIWLPERYPLQAPLMYVEPTPDMIIKPRHPFVQPSGLVGTQYLGNWCYPESDLRTLAQDTSVLFGNNPPLFSRPPSRPPPPPVPAPVSPQPRPPSPPPRLPDGYPPLGMPPPPPPQPPQPPVGYPPFGMMGMQPPPPPPQQAGMQMYPLPGPMGSPPPPPRQQQPPPPPQQPPQQQQQQQQQHPSERLTAAFCEAARAALGRRLQASLRAAADGAIEEAERQLGVREELRQRREAVAQEVKALTAERAALERLSHELEGKCTELDRWLGAHEGKAAAAAGGSDGGDGVLADVDALVVAADRLSQTALQLQAEGQAIEDTLQALDVLLGDRVISVEDYLKQVRAVSKRQFLVHVLGAKVADAQQAQQPPPPPVGGWQQAGQRPSMGGGPPMMQQGSGGSGGYPPMPPMGMQRPPTR